MGLVDSLLPEFDREMSTTRRLLDRVPDDRLDFTPHPRSTTLGGLATHVANLPIWGAMTIQRSDLDLAEAGVAELATSRADLLARFDANVATTRAALVAASDAELMAPWTLRRAGQTIFSMPRVGVWRAFVLSHIIHHRGQLTVYLRMNDVPLPSIYGPSADENPYSR